MQNFASEVLRDRLKASLWCIFIADALSMPAHWYYDVRALKKEFGIITKYVDAPEKHPSSILNLHSTGAGGRGAQSGDIVGSVILHHKKQFWGVPNVRKPSHSPTTPYPTTTYTYNFPFFSRSKCSDFSCF
jgi:hypothetical protein